MRGRISNIYGGGDCHTPHTHTIENYSREEASKYTKNRREAKPTEVSRSERSEGRQRSEEEGKHTPTTWRTQSRRLQRLSEAKSVKRPPPPPPKFRGCSCVPSQIALIFPASKSSPEIVLKNNADLFSDFEGNP